MKYKLQFNAIVATLSERASNEMNVQQGKNRFAIYILIHLMFIIDICCCFACFIVGQWVGNTNMRNAVRCESVSDLLLIRWH